MRQVHWQAKMKKFFEGQKLSAILVQEQLKAANVERQSIIQVTGHANESRRTTTMKLEKGSTGSYRTLSAEL